jgi:hypothetical protein
MSAGTANSLADRRADQRLWFPTGFDLCASKLDFVLTDRDAISAQAFLEATRWNIRDLPRRELDLQQVLAGVREGAPQLNFIWHTGFCCSTLISRAMDLPARNVSLREPEILMALAEAKREGLLEKGGRHAGLARAVFSVLAKPFPSGHQVTVKPTNAANALLAEAAALTSGQMLFLYSDCRSFLLSLAKRSEHGRSYARRLFSKLACDANPQAQWLSQKLFELSDLEIGALVWHQQIAGFRRVIPLLQAGRFASLDCDAFLTRPLETLEVLDRFLGLGLGPGHIQQVVEGSLLERDAKHAVPFGWRQRSEKQHETSLQIGKVLDEIVAWSYDVNPATPREAPLPNTLARIDKNYIC